MATDRISLQQYLGKDFIYIQSVARPTPETMREASKIAGDLIREHYCKKVLIDARHIKEHYNQFDLFRTGQEVTIDNIFKGVRIAHVLNSITDEITDFFSFASSTRGIEIRPFTNVADAKVWLFS